jgi:hypothetical protein
MSITVQSNFGLLNNAEEVIREATLIGLNTDLREFDGKPIIRLYTDKTDKIIDISSFVRRIARYIESPLSIRVVTDSADAFAYVIKDKQIMYLDFDVEIDKLLN